MKLAAALHHILMHSKPKFCNDSFGNALRKPPKRTVLQNRITETVEGSRQRENFEKTA